MTELEPMSSPQAESISRTGRGKESPAPPGALGLRVRTWGRIFLVGALLLACGRAEVSPRLAAGHRLIEEATDRLFDFAKVRQVSEDLVWRFEEAADLEAWESPDAHLFSIDQGRLRVPPGSGRKSIQLVRRLDLAAETVDFLSVKSTGLRRGSLHLYWTGPEEESFSRKRSLHLRASKLPANETGTYIFDLLQHPLWKGQITALRLDLPDIEGQVIQVSAVSVGRYDLGAEMLSRIVGGNWKVDLDHEVRNALFTPPGLPYRWELPEPASGQLRFAVGLQAGQTVEVRFRVSEGGGGQKTAPPLFEAVINPRDKEKSGRWLEGVVDLEHAVRELILETEADSGYRVESGIPAWANPEIVESSPGLERPNVILVSLDTVRADRLSLYGYGEPTSPRLESWAASQAVTFRQAVAAAPWTLPSHVSIFSGLDALRHGVNYEMPAHGDLEMLPEILRQAGYLTLAVTGGGWLHPHNGMAQGFDRFHYWSGGTAASTELEEGVDLALNLLAEYSERSFFLFFHTYEAHDPFRPRMPFASRCFESFEPEDDVFLYGASPLPREGHDGFPLYYHLVKWKENESSRTAVPISPEDLPLVGCFYDSGLAYLDEWIGKLLQGVSDLGLDQKTIIVLTSDHGESLGEHGLAKHAYLVDTNLLVPLLIGLPKGRYGGKVVDAQVSATDIFPTILDLVGIPGNQKVDGESLEPLFTDEAPPRVREAWSYAGNSNFGLSLRVNGRVKYVFNNTVWPPLRGDEHFYDLLEDTEEQRDLASSAPDRERFRSRLQEYLRSNARGMRLIIEKSGCGVLEGRLQGPSINIARVKSDHPAGADLEWIETRLAGYRVKSGESLDVLLEVALGELTLSGAIEDCGSDGHDPFEIEIDLDRLADASRLVFDGDGWRESATENGSAVMILRREGRAFADTYQLDEMDPALVEQLKALGYVE